MLHIDWSQVLSWNSLLKRHDPRPRDGSGPKRKNIFPVLFKVSMRTLKSRFVCAHVIMSKMDNDAFYGDWE